MRPTELGERARQLKREREQQLSLWETSTAGAVDAQGKRFLEYLQHDGVADATLLDATPSDVVGYLLVQGATGNTPVHVAECVQWGVMRGAANCACPRRMTVGTLRTYKFSLQTACRDTGMAGAWCPLRQAGNPCDSRAVSRFLDVTEREQLAGGVGVKQAALIDDSVFKRLMDTVWREWARATRGEAKDKREKQEEAFALARDALYYVMLWNSGLRAQDALRLNAAQLTLVAGGAYVQVAITKTTGARPGPHRIVIRDPLETREARFTVGTCWQIMDEALDALGITGTERQGPLFRKLVTSEAGECLLGPECAWDDMDRRHKAHMERAGFTAAVSRNVTLHSFHGSRACRERAQGIEKAETCENMRWSEAMYDHYIKGREPLTLEGLV